MPLSLVNFINCRVNLIINEIIEINVLLKQVCTRYKLYIKLPTKKMFFTDNTVLSFKYVLCSKNKMYVTGRIIKENCFNTTKNASI